MNGHEDSWELQHTVNTLLTRVRLGVQMLSRKGNLTDSQTQRLDEVVEALDELQDVCAKILAEMHVTAGPVSEEKVDRR